MQGPLPMMPLLQALGIVKRKMRVKPIVMTVNWRKQELKRLLKKIVAISLVSMCFRG